MATNSGMRYYHNVTGYNSRWDDFQAVILHAKQKKIDRYNQARRHAAHLYAQLIAGLSLTTPYKDSIGEHVYHQWDNVIQALQNKQISCAVYYSVPLHQQNIFKNECIAFSLPITEYVSTHCFTLTHIAFPFR